MLNKFSYVCIFLILVSLRSNPNISPFPSLPPLSLSLSQAESFLKSLKANDTQFNQQQKRWKTKRYYTHTHMCVWLSCVGLCK